jgi:hypothetical protein
MLTLSQLFSDDAPDTTVEAMRSSRRDEHRVRACRRAPSRHHTLDHSYFSVVRPAHTAALTLLP